MATRYFNWRLALILVIGAVVLVGTAYALHRWQKNTRADQALPLGERAYAQQDWEEAATQLGRYLAVNTDNVEVLLKYAEAQMNRRPVTAPHLQQAVAAYRSVLRLERTHTEAARRLAEVYLVMASPGEAELIAGRYLAERDDPIVRRLLAVALMQQRKFADSARELNHIITTDPSQVLAYESMGQLAEQRPQDVNQPATFWFDEAVARNPDSALAYIVRAGFHLRRNERKQALADLEQAESRDLTDSEVRLRLIKELMNADMLDKAKEHLVALREKNPSEQMLWRGWAELTLRLGSEEEMYAVAEAGLKELAAQPWDFMPVATELFIRSGRFDRASDCISRMRQKDILPPTAAFLEGLLAEKQGKPRDAIAHWQRAISLGYRSPGVHLMLATVFARLGDTHSAAGQLRTLTSTYPTHLDGHLALARLLVQMRNWPEAVEAARKVQQISRDHTEAILLELQARMQMLVAAGGPAGEEEQAWQSIEDRLAQIEKAGDSPLQVGLLQAQVAMVRGRFSEAEALLAELKNKYPAEVSLILLEAEWYGAQGKEQEAISRFRAAIEKFPQAFEPVRSLAVLLDRLNRRQECESLIKDAVTRVELPQTRKSLSLLLAELYRRWDQQDTLCQWLTELTKQFPDDIQSKRQLLACRQIAQDTKRAQEIVDQIKALEGDTGWQWRYEQARIWTAAEDFKEQQQDKTKPGHYAQTVKLLQENLLANPDDQASRLLLAAAYEKAGETQLAVGRYREALARSPDNVQVLVRVVAALYRAEYFTEAQEALNRAAQLGLYHPDLQKLQLRSHLQRGELAVASDILQDFAAQDPNDASVSLSLALVLMRQGKYAEAKALLDELRAKIPNSVSVVAAQIQLQIQQGNGAEAIRLCDEAVKSLNNAFAYVLRAQTHVALKQSAEALEDFSRALALEPKKVDIWAARSEFYRSVGRVSDAIADIRQALALSPDSVLMQKRAISLFLVSGEPSLVREGEALIDKALRVDSTDAQLRLFQARALLLKGTSPAAEQARGILRELTDERPRYADAWEWMARLELQQGEPGRAVDTALRGLAHNPDDRQLLLLKALAEKERSPALAALTLKGLADQYPQDVEVLIELADAYVRTDRTAQALELLRERLANFQGPARRRCEMILAAVLYKNEQREDAKLLFNTLMQAEPDDPAPLIALAQLVGRERRWSELNQLISQWRNTHPNDTGTMTAIANALAGTGDKDAIQMAEDLLRVTLERDPNSVPSLMLLGMLMQTVGRDKESVALNRKILELDPNNVIAINNLAWVLCEEYGAREEALKLAEKGLMIAPDYKDLVDTRGVIYSRLGNFEKAVADFVRCIELYPANAAPSTVPRLHLAQAYARMGRKTQATELLKETLAMQERVGGLSPQELEDARLLLDQLQKGN
jgi:tetratricopeptide (TPR) repeat protein